MKINNFKALSFSYPPVAMPSRSDMTLQNFAVQSSCSSPGPPHTKYSYKAWVHCKCGTGPRTTVKRTGKERKSIYIAPSCTKVHTKHSGMDHTVLPPNNTMPAFPSWHSPDVTTTATEAADIQLQLTTHLLTLKG